MYTKNILLLIKDKTRFVMNKPRLFMIIGFCILCSIFNLTTISAQTISVSPSSGTHQTLVKVKIAGVKGPPGGPVYIGKGPHFRFNMIPYGDFPKPDWELIEDGATQTYQRTYTIPSQTPPGKQIIFLGSREKIYCQTDFELLLEAKTVEETEKPEVHIELTLEDEDEQLTPADEAKLKVVVKNTSKSNIEKSIKVKIYTKGEVTKQRAIQYIEDQPVDQWIEERNEDLASSETWEFRVPFRVAGERNRWIFKHIIKGTSQERQEEKKPIEELAVLLDDVFWVQVEGEEVGEIENRPVPVWRILNREVAKITYPDLAKLAGTPSYLVPENRDYYRNGDRTYCYPNNEFVRFVALRAARYGGIKDASEGMHRIEKLDIETALKTEFGDYHEGSKKFYLFPEGDIKKIVKNVVHFVHRALVPKHHPGNVYDSRIPAIDIFKGIFGPFKTNRVSVFANEEEKRLINKAKQTSMGAGPRYFPCVANHYFLGSMLRALGVWVREVNIILEDPIHPWERQDFASHIYYNGDWHFWALYWEQPIQDPMKYMDRYWLFRAFTIYVGRKAVLDPKEDRPLNHPEVDQSPYWQLYGWMVKEIVFLTDDLEEFLIKKVSDDTYKPEKRFIRTTGKMTHAKFRRQGRKLTLRYGFYSPVVAMIELPDGRRIGAVDYVDPADFAEYVDEQGEKPPGLVDEIPGARYFPEGYSYYRSSIDPNSLVRVKQTILVPVNNPSEQREHKIVLRAIGDGPYRIDCEFWDDAGNQYNGGYEGRVEKDQKVVISGADLKSHRVISKPDTMDRDDVVPTVQRIWTVKVEMDWVKDTLYAWVRGQDDPALSKAELEQEIWQAALPKMMDSIKPLELKEGVPFGELMKEIPGLKDRVEEVVLQSNLVVYESERVEDIVLKICVPMRSIRETLPPGYFP